MTKLLVRAVLAIVVATSDVAIAAAAAPDPAPVIGTWQLNASRSTFTPGPAPNSVTMTYAPAGQSIAIVIKTVGADGKEGTIHLTYQLDGKDYPMTGDTDADCLSCKQVGKGNAAKCTVKKAGKALYTVRRTMSKDGKTLTLKAKGTTAKGEKYENVLVFDKQ